MFDIESFFQQWASQWGQWDRFTYKVCGAEECGTIYTYTSDIAYTCGFSCWDYFWSLVWGDTPAPW